MPSLPSGDPSTWSAASFTPDLADEIDTADERFEEILASAWRVSPAQRRALSLADLREMVTTILSQAQAAGLLQDEASSAYSPRFREALAQILSEIIDAGNARLQAQCLDFAFDLGIQMGISQTAIAEQHGMSKANVSKICVDIRERYGIRPGRGMKSEQACESYRVRQIGKRAKPTREEWRHGDAMRLAFTDGKLVNAAA